MAADDPYAVLGVERGASQDAIRAAYRGLAKKHHPDLNPGDKAAEELFKKVSTANELLSDPDKRARFDRGEIDAAGQEVPPQRPFYRSHGDARDRQKYRAQSGFDAEDLESIFGQAFGARAAGGGAGRRFDMRGGDAHYALTVSFLDAARGTVRRLTLPDGRTLDVTIPAGLRDGHVMRLRGQGEPGLGEGPPGDAMVEITVAPHPRFRREGDDIVMTLPISLREAVLGAALPVPTLRGEVRLTIPPGSGDGTRLRLRGRGIGEGHQFVELRVVVPPGDEPELAAFLRDWTPRTPFDPRAGLAAGMEEP